MTRSSSSCVLICIAIVLLSASATPASAVSVPQVTGISPSGGPITGGTTVIITGSGFIGVKDVEFGGKSGRDLQVVNDSRLTIVTPPNPEGTVPVSVYNAAGVGVSMEPVTMYEYDEYPFPRVSEVSPSSGPTAGDTVVTITGSGFTDIENVTFGGKTAWDLRVVDDSHLTARTPSSSPGTVPVAMTNTHGATRSSDPAIMYIYEFPIPELTGITPASGSTAGGFGVSITGSGFSGATDVQFGGVSGTDLIVADDSHLTIIAPPGSEGTVGISVINPAWTGRSLSSATMFRYEIPVPKLTSILPATGPIGGGTVVMLTGSGFSGARDVRFGGKSGTNLTVLNDRHLTIITPPSSPGTFPISITNAHGSGGSMGPSTLFRFFIPPTISATAMETATPAPVTSPVLTHVPAPVASTTRNMPGFDAMLGLSAVGAIILLGRTAP